MSRIRNLVHAASAVAAAALLLGSVSLAAQPALTRLQGIDELKRWFNAGAGHPRLIFLLSPT